MVEGRVRFGVGCEYIYKQVPVLIKVRLSTNS